MISQIIQWIKTEKLPLILILILFTILTAISWNKYGQLISYDSTREVVVPYLMNNGLSLYNEIFYFYSPLVPYILASITKIFGYNLSVYNIFGLLCTLLYLILIYLLSRKVLGKFGSSIVAILFLVQLAFFNVGSYILPYSYSALIGSLLVSLEVLLLVIYLDKRDIRLVYIAAFICSVNLLVKQDFAISSLMILLAFLFFNKFNSNSEVSKKGNNAEENRKFWRKITTETAKYVILISALPILVYIIIGNTIGYKELLKGISPIELLNTVPSIEFSNQLASYITLPNIIRLSGYAVISFMIILAIIVLFYGVIKSYSTFKKSEANLAILKFILIIGIILFLLSMPVNNNQSILIILINSLIYIIEYPYAGINLWLIVLVIALIRSNKVKRDYKLLFIIVASILVNYRMFFNLKLFAYSFFYLPLALIPFVYIVLEAVPSLLVKKSNISEEQIKLASKATLILISIIYLIVSVSMFLLKNHAVKTDLGIVYALDRQEYKKYLVVNEAAKYIKANTKKNEKIFAIPYLGLIYPFTGCLPVTKYYYFPPGALYNRQVEKDTVARIIKERPGYVLISSDLYFDKNLNPWSKEMFTSGRFKLSLPEQILRYYDLKITYKVKYNRNGYWKINVYKKK